MSNVQHNLQFLKTIGNTAVFFDPHNIDNQFTQNIENSRRRIGKSKVRSTKQAYSMTRHYKADVCNDGCQVNDFVGGRVILFGATPEEVATAWADLKANVDIALTKGASNGVPLSPVETSLVISPAATQVTAP